MRYRCKMMIVLGCILMSCAVFAQDRPDLPRIVVLATSAPADQMQAFEQGLQDLGHIDGSTVSIAHYSAQGRGDKLPELAQEAVALKPKVIAAVGSRAGRVAQGATQDIPIVVVTGDITTAGLVKNLARPEGNITGLSFFNVDLRLKQFEMLVKLAPQLRRVSIIGPSRLTPTGQKAVDALAVIAKERGISLDILLVDGIEGLKSELVKRRVTTEEGVFVLASPHFDAHAAEIGQLTAEQRLIAMLPWKEYVQAGGLVSYSPDIIAIWRRASSYVDRILRGAAPGDLAVEQPTQFELVINQKTADQIGITIPPVVLFQANEVIQ